MRTQVNEVSDQVDENDSPGGAINAPHHVGLHVRDLESSVEFYSSVLGFEEAFRWSPDAPYIRELLGDESVTIDAVILRLPNSNVVLELMEFTSSRPEPADARHAASGTAHVGFAVTGLDELYARLVERGVTSISEPVTPTIGPNKGGRVVYLLDPDGIRVELTQSSKWLFQFDKPAQEVCC